jgi:hypothetical protein
MQQPYLGKMSTVYDKTRHHLKVDKKAAEIILIQQYSRMTVELRAACLTKGTGIKTAKLCLLSSMAQRDGRGKPGRKKC